MVVEKNVLLGAILRRLLADKMYKPTIDGRLTKKKYNDRLLTNKLYISTIGGRRDKKQSTHTDRLLKSKKKLKMNRLQVKHPI